MRRLSINSVFADNHFIEPAIRTERDRLAELRQKLIQKHNAAVKPKGVRAL